MAEYLILIYTDETAWEAADEPTTRQTLEDHACFVSANADVLRGGNRLGTSDTATSVRRKPDGDVILTDAPFAEAKEALGGYYLIDVSDLDEALTIAQEVPAPFGGVEVRPIWPSSSKSD